SHPGSDARVSHLMGYAELSQSNWDQVLAQAIHDQEEGRFSYSLSKLDAVLKAQPTNQLALLHKGEVELALGSFQKSQLALTQVQHAPSVTAAAANAAAREMSMLPDEHKAPADVMLHPNLAPVRDHV